MDAAEIKKKRREGRRRSKTAIVLAFISVAVGSFACGMMFSRGDVVLNNAGVASQPEEISEEDELKNELSNKYMSWRYNWDGLHDAAQQGRQQFVVFTADGTRLVVPQFGAAMRHIVLVRHGQYNTEGATDDLRMLTELGNQQAAVTGMRLAVEGYRFNVIRHSTMRRAIETANIIRQFLDSSIPVTMDEQLSEGLPLMPDPNDLGVTRNQTVLGPDGFRMESAFKKYFHRASASQQSDTYELIVCHANVIRYLVCRALQIPPEAWMRFTLRHASITWLSILSNGNVLLRTFGESGHMPVNKLSE